MRPAVAEIHLDALRQNYKYARQSKSGKALAVVKADAYGHGAIACAQALTENADGFAVACIEEAIELRRAGITAPILLLEGFFETSELSLISELGLWTVIAMPWQVQAIAEYHSAHPITIWLKLDSGMHRLGLSIEDFRHAWLRLQGLPHIESIRVMSHLACADMPESPMTDSQAVTFALSCRGISAETSLCNSAGLLGWPMLANNWSRPGLILYGANPFTYPHLASAPLQPVMRVRSRVIAMRDLSVGQSVGYGARFVCQRPTRVAVVAFGYADGYPQMAPENTPVWIEGKICPLIGRVSMDMLNVDVTDHPKTEIGSEVELWGPNLPVDKVAEACQSSPYSLLCAIKRIPKKYIAHSA